MKKSVDMCNGSLMPKIIVFLIPMILTNILQQLYHMTDMMVAGKFSGDTALAAIGATGYLTSFIINLFVGVSVGASTVLSQVIGSGNEERADKVVHTAMMIAIAGGFLFSFIGIIFCRPLLVMLNTPKGILDEATLYMRIIFAGYPIVSIYNFGSAVLRAKGDTKRPFIILCICTVVHVILNLIMVIGFGMGVEGVAIPTVISQLISAVMVVIYLRREEFPYKLEIKKIRMWKNEALSILRIGIPIGVQTMMFSVSNIVIQSSINSFGETAVAGASAAGNINSLLYTILTTASHAATIFCGQNFGAKKLDRVSKTIVHCCIICVALGLFTGGLFTIFGRQVLGFFTNNPNAISCGLEIVMVISLPYCFNGMMEVFAGGLRAMNRPNTAMINSIFGLCIVRIVWIYTYFASHRSLGVLYYSYPLSWIVTLAINVVCFMTVLRKYKKEEGVAASALRTDSEETKLHA